MASGDGSRVAYWCARPDLIRSGYRPKTAGLAERCHALQAEMLTSAENRTGIERHEVYDGPFASLVRLEASPFHELTEGTQRAYSKTMGRLMRHKGERREGTTE
jgi:hypothetical protein